MTEAKCCGLEHVRDSRMYVWLVAAIGIEPRTAEKGGKVFVHEDILKRGDDQASGSLKNVFVAPARVLLLHAVR